MKTVYGLTSGEYSGWTVHGLCPTREVAEAIQRRVNAVVSSRDGVDITEFDFYESADAVSAWVEYVVEVDTEGREIRRHSIAKSSLDYPADNEGYSFSSPVPGSYGALMGTPTTHFGTSTRGFDTALKVARDRRAAYLAERAGVA